MEIVRNLVQNLIIIVVLAVFLEMLLPAGDMRRYVKLVMGLLIIVAMLQAVAGLVRGNWQVLLPEPVKSNTSSGVTGLADIMAGGQQLSARHQSKALEEYRQGLSRQVAALAGLNSRVQVLGAKVEVYEDPRDRSFGQVREIRLLLGATPPGGEEKEEKDFPSVVEPVTVEVGGDGVAGDKNTPGKEAQVNPAPEVERAARQLAEMVANFYNLSTAQVKVEFYQK